MSVGREQNEYVSKSTFISDFIQSVKGRIVLPSIMRAVRNIL